MRIASWIIGSFLILGGLLLLSPCAAHAAAPTAHDLHAAIAIGNFNGYQESLARWLNATSATAGTSNAASEAPLKALLQDAAFLQAVDQHQFIASVGPTKLSAFALADKQNQKFLRWVLGNTSVMDLYLLAGGTPTGDAAVTTLKFWNKVYQNDADSHAGITLKIAIATALVHPTSFTDERTPRRTDPYEGRYLYYKKVHQDGELLPSFDHLSTWEYTKVLDGMGAPPEDLTWVRQMLRTWRPDLFRNNTVVKIVSEVRYGHSPIEIVDMASVLDAGGICGRRSYFGRKTCAAFGVPAIGILQPQHAALACKSGNEWRVEYGAGWKHSWLEAGQDGDAFVAEAAARSHEVEFAQGEHLKWFAAALTSKEAAKAIIAIADKLAPRTIDAKLMAKTPETKVEMEANGQSKTTSTSQADAASITSVEAGTLHIAADHFAKMANVMVYGSLPDGTGKQVNFQKSLNDSWIDYTIDVPKAGTYSLVLQLAAPNRDQLLRVSVHGDVAGGANTSAVNTSGAGSGNITSMATIKVPNTRGLWGTTPAVDLTLAQGKQTVRISAPFQRGIAVKWIELKLK